MGGWDKISDWSILFYEMVYTTHAIEESYFTRKQLFLILAFFDRLAQYILYRIFPRKTLIYFPKHSVFQLARHLVLQRTQSFICNMSGSRDTAVELDQMRSSAPSFSTTLNAADSSQLKKALSSSQTNSSLRRGSILVSREDGAPKVGLAFRHTYSMALTAGIGTGLWIATASGLYHGGPLGLIFGFVLVGLMLYLLMGNTAEILSLHPHDNGFFGYVQDFLGETMAFALCYNYLLLFLFCFPAELVAATTILKLIWPSIPIAAFIAVFMVFCLVIQAMPSKVYGESEFAFAIIKFVSLVVAIFTIIVMDAGGFSAYKPDQSLIWQTNRLWGSGIGPLQVLLGAGFAMGGIELFTLGVLETKDARRSAKNNIYAIIARLVFCYILTVCLFASVVYSGDETLSGTTSPIFEALRLAKSDALRTTMIVFVLLTLISASNTSMYLCKQAVRRTAQFGYLPVPKRYIKHFTRPLCWPGLILSVGFGTIAFMTVSSSGAKAFEYLMGVVAMGNYITWTCMLLAHWRFRRALAKLSKDSSLGRPAQLPYKTFGPVWLRNSFIGSVLGVAFVAAHILAINPLDDQKVTAITFLCRTGIIYIFIIISLGHAMYNKFIRKRRVFPRPVELQAVVTSYLNSYTVYHANQDTATKVDGIV